MRDTAQLCFPYWLAFSKTPKHDVYQHSASVSRVSLSYTFMCNLHSHVYLPLCFFWSLSAYNFQSAIKEGLKRCHIFITDLEFSFVRATSMQHFIAFLSTLAGADQISYLCAYSCNDNDGVTGFNTGPSWLQFWQTKAHYGSDVGQERSCCVFKAPSNYILHITQVREGQGLNVLSTNFTFKNTWILGQRDGLAIIKTYCFSSKDLSPVPRTPIKVL